MMNYVYLSFSFFFILIFFMHCRIISFVRESIRMIKAAAVAILVQQEKNKSKKKKKKKKGKKKKRERKEKRKRTILTQSIVGVSGVRWGGSVEGGVASFAARPAPTQSDHTHQTCLHQHSRHTCTNQLSN